MIIKCESLVDPTDENLKLLEVSQRFFLDMNRPMKFNPYEADNVLMSSEMQFEEICATMEENGIGHPKELSEFEFYNRLMYYEKKYKELSKT